MSDERFDIKETDLRVMATPRFSDNYKLEVFQIWYNSGRLGGRELRNLVPVPETNYGRKPSEETLSGWIIDFKERAAELDQQVRETMDIALIQSKVEMLKRHVEVGKEMQKIALDYLRGTDLTPSAAVRLLADGIAVERNSMGIPEALAKVISMSDEQLYEALRDEIENAPIERTEPNE